MHGSDPVFHNIAHDGVRTKCKSANATKKNAKAKKGSRLADPRVKIYQVTLLG